MQNLKTNFDLILDRVEQSGEVTLTVEGEMTRELIHKVEEAAHARGMSAAYDGHRFLIRNIRMARQTTQETK